MSLSARQIKARRYSRMGFIVAVPAYPDEGPDDDYYDDEGEYACTHCGGEGYREVEDPLWDDCDEFGYGPCTSCYGTGLRSRQWVF